MSKVLDLDAFRARRRVPTHCVRYDDARAARFYGEEFRVQHLYFWTEREALAFADGKTLGGGPARVEKL